MGVTAGGPSVSRANAEAIEAWDGPLVERFVKYRHIVVAALKQFGDEAMRCTDLRPAPGSSTSDAASATPPSVSRNWSVPMGWPLAWAASRFIEAACAEAEESGVANVRFDVIDVERVRSPSGSATRYHAWGRCSSRTRSRRCQTSAKRSCPVDGW